MATLQIVEFAETQNGDQIPVAKNVLATQNVTYTTAASSAAMQDGTKLIRVIATAAAYIDLNGATATANSLRLPADTVEYFGIEKGQTISVYDGSS